MYNIYKVISCRDNDNIHQIKRFKRDYKGGRVLLRSGEDNHL